MPAHKKTPNFIRLVTSEKKVVCLNPLHFASFEIVANAKIKIKAKEVGGPDTIIEADTVRFYLPVGTCFSYSVGIDLTQPEFNYICDTLTEFVYLNETEFKSKTEALKKAQMDEWNKISEENNNKMNAAVAESKQADTPAAA